MSHTAASLVPSWVTSCLFRVCSVSIRDAEGLGGCGSGVFIGAEVDGEGVKGSGGTLEVDIQTILETIISHIFTYIQSDTHTHTHTQVRVYIPWIHKSVRKNVGFGTNHKYTIYTNLQCKYNKYFTITV